MATKDRVYAAAEKIFRRDGWVCQYCKLDGRESVANWRPLTWDHLLPSSDMRRDSEDFIVTACGSCNMTLCQFWRVAQREAKDLVAATREELLAWRQTYLSPFLIGDEQYWRTKVATERP